MLLFGADKVPDIARSVGRFQARIASARREIEAEMKTAEERERESLSDFERERERKMVEVLEGEVRERARLEAAARALGVDPAGKSDEELRAAIGREVGG